METLSQPYHPVLHLPHSHCSATSLKMWLGVTDAAVATPPTLASFLVYELLPTNPTRSVQFSRGKLPYKYAFEGMFADPRFRSIPTNDIEAAKREPGKWVRQSSELVLHAFSRLIHIPRRDRYLHSRLVYFFFVLTQSLCLRMD